MIIKKVEHGQALVLIALSLVAILAFAALAVDGGRVYSEQRRAQNAADAAAYAAASARIYDEPVADAIAAALSQAGINGFSDADAGANPSQLVDVQVYSPPIEGPFTGLENFYQVIIRSHVDNVFSQVVYPDGLEVSAEAVTRSQSEGPIALGDAIHATTLNDCNGIFFNGSASVIVNGGNISAESIRNGTPTSCHSMSLSGGGAPTIVNVEVTDGDVISSGTQDFPDGTVVADHLLPNTLVPPLLDLPVPDCSTPTKHPLPTYMGNTNFNNPGEYILDEGIYPDGIRISHKDAHVRLNPGIYCLDADFNASSGLLEGFGVFIYMRGGAGNDSSSVDFSGNATVKLSASGDIQDGLGNQWNGMLIYMQDENEGDIYISGASDNTFFGTIYAVGPTKNPNEKCIFLGNSDTGEDAGEDPLVINSSIYCYSIQIGGTANVVVQYIEGQNYQQAPRIELME